MDSTNKMEVKKFTPVIGLEVHIELATKSKMFCGCPADHFGEKPNTQTCPVCLGLPGALPVPNKQAIHWTVLTGLVLGCTIPKFSKFDRKNYFYPDLPKGYQISQYDAPPAINGKLEVGSWKLDARSGKLEAGKEVEKKTIRIRRVHLEEDTGKLIHIGDSTMIDFNRSGVPLMEIVTEPDMNSSVEVKTFLQSLQQIVRYLGISDADMEKGQMRCEPTVNLEIDKDKDKVYTPLVEIKNVNSFRFVQRAIDFEIKRQFEEFERTQNTKLPGNKTTRGWSEAKQETFLQREKEEAADYRYFPEPDIPPMRWRNEEIEKLRNSLPEMPEIKMVRFVKQYGLSINDARILTECLQTANYYEETVRVGKEYELSPKHLANLIINKRFSIEKMSPSELVEMLAKSKETPIISQKELDKIIKNVLLENPKAVNDFKGGKNQAIMFLVGKVMVEAKGQVEAGKVRERLASLLVLTP